MSTPLELMKSSVNNIHGALEHVRDELKHAAIGLLHPSVPGELVYAAGLHPFVMWPYGDEPVSLADASIQTYVCSQLRSIWDQALKDRFPIRGAIIPRTCDAITCLYQTWKRHNPVSYTGYLNIPWKETDGTQAFYVRELQRLKDDIEKFAGQRVTDAALQDAISVSNRHQSIMNTVFNLMKEDRPPLSGSDLQKIILSGLIMDRNEHTALLSHFLERLPAVGSVPAKRLLISGTCLTDTSLFEMIESCGALIAANDSDFGPKAVGGLVVDSGSGLEGISRKYMAMRYSFNTSIEDRFKYISGLVNDYRIDAVIFALFRACEVEKLAYPELSRKVKEELNLPVLYLEVEHRNALAPLRTRVQAFLETIS